MKDWRIFTGELPPRSKINIPPPPPWRPFRGKVVETPLVPKINADDPYWERARAYQLKDNDVIIDVVNAALHLRRPILVTGNPGTGKSTLIYRVAYELDLGPVLVWPINSRTTLKDGLYEYDALARLRDQQMHEEMQKGKLQSDIGQYITLGPLGTALVPDHRPRALLIDEIDKADVDLPNDLLNVLEEGWFEIPELVRYDKDKVEVWPLDASRTDPNARPKVTLTRGRVECHEFPFIVITSNRERQFPPAFLRRCLRITMPDPDEAKLAKIVAAHLGDKVKDADELINYFAKQPTGTVATDQLLNAVHLVIGREGISESDKERLKTVLLREIAPGP